MMNKEKEEIFEAAKKLAKKHHKDFVWDEGKAKEFVNDIYDMLDCDHTKWARNHLKMAKGAEYLFNSLNS